MGKYELILNDYIRNKKESLGWCLTKKTAEIFKLDIEKEIMRDKKYTDKKSFRISIKQHKIIKEQKLKDEDKQISLL